MRWAARAAFAVGASLLALNVAGLFLSLRSSALPAEFDNDRIVLDYGQAMRQIQRARGESDGAYVRRLTTVIQRATLRFWPSERLDDYRLRVPAWENYLLYARSFIEPSSFQKYEFCDYHKAIERGIGLCSQQAVMLTEIVRERGMEADIVHLGGHVVARVKTSGSWVLADPYFGVVIPKDVDEVGARPQIVAPFYEQAGLDAPLVRKVVWIYGKKDNRIYKGGARGYLPVNYRFERASYSLMWLIPIVGMMPQCVSLLWSRVRAKRSGQKPEVSSAR